MQSPFQITFRHMDSSSAVTARVREHLERFHGRITSGQVVVEAPPGHQRNGAPFQIKIDLAMPGHEVHVRSECAEGDSHADVYVALRDAFDSAKRQLRRAHSDPASSERRAP